MKCLKISHTHIFSINTPPYIFLSSSNTFLVLLLSACYTYQKARNHRFNKTTFSRINAVSHETSAATSNICTYPRITVSDFRYNCYVPAFSHTNTIIVASRCNRSSFERKILNREVFRYTQIIVCC